MVKGKNFGGLKAGKLNPDYFRVNATGMAVDGNDYFVYKTTDNTLYYDKDGGGPGAPVKLALIGNGVKLRAEDILVS